MGALDIIFLIIAVIVIILSLLQGGKSEGASGAITGSGMNIFVKTKERGSELFISWMTLGFAITFFILALLVNALSGDATPPAA
jgi:preprotein translocase subunit SecG